MDGFADIDGPVRIGFPWLYLLIGLLALISLVGLVLFLRRRKAKPAGAAEPVRSPLEIALERLDRLQTDAASLPADPFIVEVSDIVRDYLETALNVPAREQTSEEFLQTLQTHTGLPDILKAHMPPFLDQCDLVKFARQALAGAQRERLLETAGTVVRETNASIENVAEANKKEALAV